MAADKAVLEIISRVTPFKVRACTITHSGWQHKHLVEHAQFLGNCCEPCASAIGSLVCLLCVHQNTLEQHSSGLQVKLL